MEDTDVRCLIARAGFGGWPITYAEAISVVSSTSTFKYVQEGLSELEDESERKHRGRRGETKVKRKSMGRQERGEKIGERLTRVCIC